MSAQSGALPAKGAFNRSLSPSSVCVCIRMRASVCSRLRKRPEVGGGCLLSCSPLVSETESLTDPGAHSRLLASEPRDPSGLHLLCGYRYAKAHPGVLLGPHACIASTLPSECCQPSFHCLANFDWHLSILDVPELLACENHIVSCGAGKAGEILARLPEVFARKRDSLPLDSAGSLNQEQSGWI